MNAEATATRRSGQDKVSRLLAIRRIRLVQAIIAVAVLAAAEQIAGRTFYEEWWFWVGSVAVVTAALIEPYFTGPGAALLYAIGAGSVMFSAERAGVSAFWAVYLGLAIVVAVSSVVSMVAGSGRLQDLTRWSCTRLGRPLVLGFAALGIEVVRLAHAESLNVAVSLAIGTLIALLLCSLDWYRVWAMSPFASSQLAVVESAIEPNLLLVSTNSRLAKGTRVRVTGTGVATGIVASNLAHKQGSRVQIVLDVPWDRVTQSGGADCVLEPLESEPDGPVAFAAEGSTERTLSLHPFTRLGYGDTVFWDKDDTKYLYQVVGLTLERQVWDSSTVIEERAKALQLGAVREGQTLELLPALPDPYLPVRSAREVAAAAIPGYERLGVVSGTKIEFGLSSQSLRSHHLAILGMSGMGKSTVSRRICDLMKDSSFVVALDGTGEYRMRFGLAPLDTTRTKDENGLWVYEPGGQPAEQAMKFIKSLMESASAEYQGGACQPRTLLIEEAHAFLPEWNFNANRNESEWVSQSCRFILQARKFGLGFVMVSQRTAVISKSALSQCESYVIFRTLDGTSLDYIESIVGPDMRRAVSSLKRYQAVCVGPAFSTTSAVIVDFDPPVGDGA